MSRSLRQASEAGVIAPRTASPPPRRHLSLARFVGAAGLVVLTVLLYWLLTDESFRVTEAGVSFEGLRYADEDAVRAQLSGLDRSPNVFRVRATEIVSRLQDLPEVASARAVVTLPGDVFVRVEEREPIFIWSDGQRAWLVDREGMLFATTPGVPGADATEGTAETEGTTEGAAADIEGSDVGSAGPPVPGAAPDGAAAADAGDVRVDDRVAGLPTVDDWRFLEQQPTVGTYLPVSDVAVMRQLLALTPELLGSRARELWLRVDQHDGYVLHSDRGWQAIFGNYTPTVQPPDVVPFQVQCLRWLLAAEERQLERVRLAVTDAECGTFSRVGGPG